MGNFTILVLRVVGGYNFLLYVSFLFKNSVLEKTLSELHLEGFRGAFDISLSF
jgi:hypothetical protein